MCVVENTAQPEHFCSIPTTMWWSLITLTTVGKLVGAFTAMMGVYVVALLTGIAGTAFANQISKRHDLLEAEILAALKDGLINKDEMRKITQMQDELGMSEEHAKAMIELLRDRHHSR